MSKKERMKERKKEGEKERKREREKERKRGTENDERKVRQKERSQQAWDNAADNRITAVCGISRLQLTGVLP